MHILCKLYHFFCRLYFNSSNVINYVYVQKYLPKALYHLNHELNPVQPQQLYPVARVLWVRANGGLTPDSRETRPLRYERDSDFLMAGADVMCNKPSTKPCDHCDLQETLLRIARRMSAIPLVPSPSCKNQPRASRFTERIDRESWWITI